MPAQQAISIITKMAPPGSDDSSSLTSFESDPSYFDVAGHYHTHAALLVSTKIPKTAVVSYFTRDFHFAFFSTVEYTPLYTPIHPNAIP